MFTEPTDITAKEVKRLLLGVYRRYTSKRISKDEAYRETYILNSILKAIEVTDLEGRLQNIENILKDEQG